MKTGSKTPQLAYKKMILDDGTMGTIGNGNSIIENGETVRLYITAVNSGSLEAKDVYLRLNTNTGGARASGGDHKIGTIAPAGKVPAGSILLTLDHTFSGTVLPVKIRMTQLEFDAFEETLNRFY